MAIKVGEKLPDGTLTEMIETEREGCTIGPNAFKVSDLAKGKKIVIFGVPGAFTPTCSAKHVPGYKDRKAAGKVRMMADGSAAYTKALGLEFDLVARGMGVRAQRFSMLVDDGVVKALNVEAPGKFEVSDAETMLKQL